MFISNAYAQATNAAAQTPASGIMSILPLIIMFAIAWLLMIRPQMKRAKEHKTMLEGLAKGDEVVTQGGIAGKVINVEDNFVRVGIANNVEVLVQKVAITTVLPKGSLKSA